MSRNVDLHPTPLPGGRQRGSGVGPHFHMFVMFSFFILFPSSGHAGIFLCSADQESFDIYLYGRWEDLNRWKQVALDVGVIWDTSASHSEHCFRHFWGPTSLYPNTPPPYTPGQGELPPPNTPEQLRIDVGACLRKTFSNVFRSWVGATRPFLRMPSEF